jgi:hypothetical protein
MRKLYLFPLLTLLFINLQAQTFEWAKIEGRYAYDYGYGITTDNAGNVYVVGKYEEVDANFSGTLVPCQGNHDIFTAKYAPSGALTWIRTAGGITGDYAWGVACDNSYVYVTGEIEGAGETIEFVGSSITLTAVGSNDIFVAKYDVSGNLLWAKSAGGSEYEKGIAVAYDNSGNVYVCGLYTGTVIFGGTTTIHNTNNGTADLFVAKYDADGNFLWVRHAGSPGRDEAKGIKCDAAGNVYITGMYSEGCVFESQTLTTHNPPNWFDIFLAKYDPSGNLQWVKTAGGDYDDVAWGLVMDNSGNLIIAGEYNAYNFEYALTTTGMADVFVAAYNTSGNLLWARGAGGTQIDRARGLGTDGTNLFITGQFGGTANFGSHSVSSADSSDVFIVGLTNNGDFAGAASVGGPADAVDSLGFESGIAVTGYSGAVYATGSVLDGGTFGSISPSFYTRTDVFVTRLSNLIGIEELIADNGIAVFPNPSAGSFTVYNSADDAELSVYNVIGEEIYYRKLNSSQQNVNLQSVSSGIYFVELKNTENKIYRQKILIDSH